MNDTEWDVEAGPQSINPQYAQLVPLAQSFGIDDWPGGPQLSLTLDGVPCVIGLHFIDRGVIDACTVEVTLERSPGALRKETDIDRADKTEGHDQVFIDSNASDDDVKRLLRTDGMRSAAQWVLANDGTVTISAFKVRLTFPARGHSTIFEPTALRQAIASALILAREGPPEGKVRAGHGAWLLPATIGVALVSGGALIFASQTWSAGVLFPFAIFMIGGFIAHQVLRPSIRRLTAGDAGSGGRSQTVGFFAFIAAGLLLAGAGVAGNAVFDHAPAVTESGTITSIDVDRKSHNRVANITWSDGETSSRPLDTGEVGDRVELTFKPGVLRARWREVVTTSHVRLDRFSHDSHERTPLEDRGR